MPSVAEQVLARRALRLQQQQRRLSRRTARVVRLARLRRLTYSPAKLSLPWPKKMRITKHSTTASMTALRLACSRSKAVKKQQSPSIMTGHTPPRGHLQDMYVNPVNLCRDCPNDSQYANGYVPPPKLPWTQAFAIGLRSFWKWFLTPLGFFITLYGLNVVAWGGMLFLLLCNAAPAMCKPDCNDINSPRRKWIEIDSQILNALFCVTGFGLAPWRFRDLYWWGWWRISGPKRRVTGIRRLAGIHRGWFRLPGSDELPDDADATVVDPKNPAVPIPVTAIPDPPPTAIRAPPTRSWTMDLVVWFNVLNTLLQVLLCFYMWHYNRINRPSWATGLFVALACIASGIAGIVTWQEGKQVKKFEGVPVTKDYKDEAKDAEASAGIPLVTAGVAPKS